MKLTFVVWWEMLSHIFCKSTNKARCTCTTMNAVVLQVYEELLKTIYPRSIKLLTNRYCLKIIKQANYSWSFPS